QRSAKRADQLRADKLISEAEYDTARANLASLEAQYSAAEHQVAASESSMKVQRQSLTDLEVRAPFAGVVVAKAAQPGEIISPMSAGGFTRTGIATIVDMDSLEIEVDVNESFIQRVTSNMKTEAILDAYPEWTIPSHVVSIVPTADRAKATVKVRVGFDKLDPRILPDMGVKVRFMDNKNESSSTSTSAIELPATVIVTDSNHRYIWKVNDNKLERVAVSTGIERNGRMQVLAGAQAGDHVVNNPAPTLQDGMKVKAKN
ncbi:MAG TPA: efflux RND transporter periplasmic adaptor subunit, partial [Steroidobacteraceae bacterium]|nr:efflux RND transporter periplasmic adaptor subunit [Steroidobacteraceae bacterium]